MRFRKVPDGLTLLRKREDAVVVDVVSEKVQFRHFKQALAGVDDDAVCQESLKNGT